MICLGCEGFRNVPGPMPEVAQHLGAMEPLRRCSIYSATVTNMQYMAFQTVPSATVDEHVTSMHGCEWKQKSSSGLCLKRAGLQRHTLLKSGEVCKRGHWAMAKQELHRSRASCQYSNEPGNSFSPADFMPCSNVWAACHSARPEVST